MCQRLVEHGRSVPLLDKVRGQRPQVTAFPLRERAHGLPVEVVAAVLQQNLAGALLVLAQATRLHMPEKSALLKTPRAPCTRLKAP